MTDEQKAALGWLRRNLGGSNTVLTNYAETILAMLAEPRLPKEPSDDLFDAMNSGWSVRSVYASLYAHLTKPATKTVEVWRVEYAQLSGSGWEVLSTSHAGKQFVELLAKNMREQPSRYACVHVTGPHAQEVPT